MRRNGFVALLAALLLFSGLPACFAEDKAPAKELSSDEYYELMKVFVDTFQQIDRNYVKDVDRKQLVEAAVQGMLEKLDPYSDYISPKDLQKFTESVESEFGGVGIHVNFDRDQRNIEVMSTLPGAPAAQAGIKAGDRILEIEGKAIKEFTNNQEIDTAITLLRGEPGKEVNVTIKHLAGDAVETLTLKRAIIKTDTVLGDSRKPDGTWNYWLDESKKIAYLRLTNFAGRSGDEMQEILQQLKKDGMKGLILDLRFNPGGKLEAAVEIADLFLESGLIVSTEGRNALPQKFAAKKFGTFTGFPMAVLINHYSASASEIVSAALQDHKRAIVVGERSWGKGSVQTVINMDVEGSKAALKLTTAAYHRPSGKNIHRFPESKESDEWGVMPNDGYAVPFSPAEYVGYQRYRLQRDAIRPREPIIADFPDSQLKKARDYIEKELTKPETASNVPAPEGDGKDEKKKPEPKPTDNKTSSAAPELSVLHHRAA
ncbi:MAG TPA: S41 family peptidase [Caulifigura sp.]|nr:S41 family peptidase [Caulifigura sp.]